MKPTVTSRARVTILRKLRERLGIDPGSVLRLHEHDGRIVLLKDVPEDPVKVVFGVLRHLHQETDSVVGELRSRRTD